MNKLMLKISDDLDEIKFSWTRYLCIQPTKMQKNLNSSTSIKEIEFIM